MYVRSLIYVLLCIHDLLHVCCRVSLYKALVSIYITGFVMINPVFDDLLIINKAATDVCISCLCV